MESPLFLTRIVDGFMFRTLRELNPLKPLIKKRPYSRFTLHWIN